MFITALTSFRHLPLSWASPIQSIYPHPTSWRSILILSTHLRLGLPSGLLPSGFPTKTQYTPLSSPICSTCLAHLSLLDFIARTILGEEPQLPLYIYTHTHTHTVAFILFVKTECGVGSMGERQHTARLSCDGLIIEYANSEYWMPAGGIYTQSACDTESEFLQGKLLR